MRIPLRNRHSLRFAVGFAFVVVVALMACPAPAWAARSERLSSSVLPGTVQQGTPMVAVGSAVVNFTELARQERLGLQVHGAPPVRPLIPSRLNEGEAEAEPEPNVTPESMISLPSFVPFVASPLPTQSFIGLDDIPMVDSSFIVIPPDVNGAVGPAHIFQNLNNNVRILDKSDGSVVSTVGVNTFWAATGASPNNYTDPRTVYDPYNGRFIAIMQGDLDNSTGNSLVIGLSDTDDPAGSWHLYRTILFLNGSSALYDFPTLGFNKNWITVSINRFNSGGALQGNTVITIHYPNLRSNAFTAFRFDRSDFCAAPCQTYSATSDTEYVLVHLSSAGATYRCDQVRGTGPAAPTYTAGSTRTRTGGAWVQGSGQTLPQSAPNAGASSCGATPCKIELIDAQIRTPPVFRGGSIWYSQTIGLPSGGLTHTAAQWTQVTTPTGIFVDGGRIEDPTATATNGGKWYAYPQIAVNANGDFMVGYSQFSSAQHPSAGYSVHLGGDGAGSIRDAVIFHAGEDYYHKDFGSGRNRWGDFSSAQVDPTDDMTLWTVQEYGKTRPGTNDGATGSNSSRWSTWWAALAPPVVTIDAGPSQSEGNSGTTAFSFTARLSYAYGLPIIVSFHTSDGTATVADNDYQPLTSSVTIPAGSTTATITVNVVGDTGCESDETFGVTLDIADNNIQIGASSVATATILNDEAPAITASAGAGGSISPPGTVVLACGGSQAYTIAPDTCHAILDVKVDAISVGAVAGYTFNSVQDNHTIDATFSVLGPYTVTASAGAGGTISPSGAALVACGGSQAYTIAPDACNAILDVKVDGISVGAVTNYTFNDVHADHAIDATFGSTSLALSDTHADASCTGVADGSIDLTVAGGVAPFSYAWSNGAMVEDISGLAAGIYMVTVTDAQGCVATRSDTIRVPQYTITATAGPNGSIAASGSVSVDCGTDATFNITPDPGYTIDELTVDAVSVTPALSYTFTNVTANHTISVTFKSAALAADTPKPMDFALSRVSPNPAPHLMRFQYGLPVPSAVRLTVVDVQGREVAVLAEGLLSDGWYSASWGGETGRGRAPAGLYFVRLRAGGRNLIRRFALTH